MSPFEDDASMWIPPETNIKLMVYNNYLNGQVVSINIKLSREKSITIYDFLFMIHDTFTNTDFKL